MKSKTSLFVLFSLLIVLSFAVTPAFAAQGVEPPVGEVALPVELQALVAMGFGYIVTQGLKSLSTLLGKDLSGYAAAITASVVTTVIYFFDAILSAVPTNAAPSVEIGLMLLVSILGAFGVYKTVKSFQPAAKK